MIRVRKSNQIPEGIQREYNHENVTKQLLLDQNEKCYLCERHLVTDYEVEHLRPQSTNEELVKDWENLFLACSYCNKRKSASYDCLLEPQHHNIEDVIVHSVRFMEKEAMFHSSDESEAVMQTMHLLSKLFNGKAGLRKHKEQRFFDEFIRELNVFAHAVNNYLDEVPDSKQAVEEQLDIRSEYLGFKYAVICNHPTLNRDFGSFVCWNKQ